MLKTLRQIYESLRMSLQSIAVNKMRTFLSLMGITIGIFSIISVFTGIDSMERYIRSNFEKLGSDVLYVSKWPWTPEGDGEYKWWKYMNRPQSTISEFNQIKNKFEDQIDQSAFSVNLTRNIKYLQASMENVTVNGVSDVDNNLFTMTVENGRMFSPSEVERGTPVALIGANIAEELFDGENPVGKSMKIGARTVDVIGVLEREGDNMFGISNDDNVSVPLNFARTIANLRYAETTMLIKPKPTVGYEDFKAELEQYLRQIKRLPLGADNTFSINELTAISSQLNQVFGSINLVGGIIGIFAIIIGGFGVANIMFVSVRERTSQIGVQKALGAKPYVILCEFMFEAVILSMIGGAVGLLLIWIIALVASHLTGFDIVLTMSNISIGLGISSLVGAISGFFPAWGAAQMQPVKAIYKT